MVIRIGKWDYRISFQHIRANGEQNGATKCRICRTKGLWEDFESGGDAILKKGDRYCKSTGRKISLAKALRNSLTFTTSSAAKSTKRAKKSARRKVWTAYFAAHGGIK